MMVWVSRAMVHPSNQRPFRNDIAKRDHDRLLEIGRANGRGEKLALCSVATTRSGNRLMVGTRLARLI
jgi:hypothetical protein